MLLEQKWTSIGKKVDTIEQKWTLSAKSGHNQAKVDTIGQKWTAQQFNATIFT